MERYRLRSGHTRKNCQKLEAGASKNLKPKEKLLVKLIAVTFSILLCPSLFFSTSYSFLLLSPLFSPLKFQTLSLFHLLYFLSLLSVSSYKKISFLKNM